MEGKTDQTEYNGDTEMQAFRFGLQRLNWENRARYITYSISPTAIYDSVSTHKAPAPFSVSSKSRAHRLLYVKHMAQQSTVNKSWLTLLPSAEQQHAPPHPHVQNNVAAMKK